MTRGTVATPQSTDGRQDAHGEPPRSAVPSDANSQTVEFVRADEMRSVIETTIRVLAGALDDLRHALSSQAIAGDAAAQRVDGMRAKVVADLGALLGAPDDDPLA